MQRLNDGIENPSLSLLRTHVCLGRLLACSQFVINTVAGIIRTRLYFPFMQISIHKSPAFVG